MNKGVKLQVLNKLSKFLKRFKNLTGTNSV